jgi:serine/threonine protein kinase
VVAVSQGGGAAGDVVDGRYELREHLGSGGFAAVWRAIDLRTRTSVALRLPDYSGDNRDAQVDAGFEGEARALRRLASGGGHPGVVGFRRASLDGARPTLVTAFVEGPTLERALARGDLSPSAEAFNDVGVPVVEAMAYVHELGLSYLDCKPENVIHAADGPVLIDFNTATAGTSPIEFGDDAYKAPEQVRGNGAEIDAGPWSDVYALGKLLVRLTSNPTGRFDQPGWVPSQLASGLSATLERATAADPADRQMSATELLVDLMGPTDGGATATLRLGNRTATVREGDTIGRDAPGEPDPDIVVRDEEQYVDAPQARFDRVDGRWTLTDLSVNGTYVRAGDDWLPTLSRAGAEERGPVGDVPGPRPPATRWLGEEATVALVDPSYSVTFEFSTG